MSDPRYRPRDYLASGRFGVTREPRWHSIPAASPVEQRQLDAARLQHELARTISNALNHRGITEGSYAEAAGYSVDRLQRVLRGQALMRLEDVATARRLLGIGLAGAPRR